MLRIAIVEDEAGYVKTLQKYIMRYDRESEEPCLVQCFTNGLDFLESYRPDYDVVFMDIRMPHMDGMEAALSLRRMDEDVAIIFITNMAQYAIRGYEVNALDFMVKPVEYAEVRQKLNKVRRYLKKYSSASIALNINGAVKKISIRTIFYIEVRNHSLIYHTEEGNYTVYGQLKELEQNNNFSCFARCKSCYLVNLSHVTETNGDCITVGGDVLYVSRRLKKVFMQALSNFMGGGHI